MGILQEQQEHTIGNSVTVLWEDAMRISWESSWSITGTVWEHVANTLGALWKQHENTLGKPWGILWESQGILWESHNNTSVILQEYYGNGMRIPLGILWQHSGRTGNTLGRLWEQAGNAVAILEEYNVNTVGILWEYHGNAVGMMSMAFWGEHRGNTIRTSSEYYYSLIYKSMGIAQEHHRSTIAIPQENHRRSIGTLGKYGCNTMIIVWEERCGNTTGCL